MFTATWAVPRWALRTTTPPRFRAARILADGDARSAALAAARPDHLDVHYGLRERNRIDYFSAGADKIYQESPA